jgi:hypothetical protein
MPTVEYPWLAERPYASVGTTTLGTAIPTYTCTAAQLGGFITYDLPVPRNFDRSRDAFLDTWIYRPGGALIGGNPAVFQVAITISPPGLTPVEVTYPVTKYVPTNWPNQTRLSLALLNAGAPAFPASSIPDQAVIGVRFYRDGPNVGDLYPVILGFPPSLRLQYNQLCGSFGGCF